MSVLHFLAIFSALTLPVVAIVVLDRGLRNR